MSTSKPKPEASAAPQLYSIEELKVRHETSDAIFVGVAASKEWKPGKQVEEQEYLRAVEIFLGSPMDGKRVKADA